MWWFRRRTRPKPDVIVREEVETDEERRIPKLASLTKPLSHWISLYEHSFAAQDDLPRDIGPKHPDYEWFTRQLSNAYSNRVVATWGMIAKGAEAVPYALKMLKSTNADIREDAGGILQGIGRQPGVVDELIRALDREPETQTRDSIISALGAMKDKKAIPVLAAIVRDPHADGDTQWGAVEAIGRLARRNFLKQSEPVAACLAWLDRRDAK